MPPQLDFAALSCGQEFALVIHDRDGDEWGWLAGGGEAFPGQRAVGVEVIFRREGGDHHRRLGLPEQLCHDRADRADGLLQASR